MLIILVSYRARGVQEFRGSQLFKTIQNFKTYLKESKIDFKIVISEQHNDEKFNRGLLLNAAFLESERQFEFPKKYMHMNTDYNFNLTRKFPQEILDFETGFLDLLSPDLPVLSAACVFDGYSYKAINGFPNNLEGWGGDDWAIFNRIMNKNITISKPPGLHNSNFIVEEHVSFNNDQSNNMKNIELAKQNDFEYNGLNSTKYNIDGNGEFHDGYEVFHYLIN